MTYELWSTRTRNLVGSYGTEAAALEAVRPALVANGATYLETLALACEDDAGRTTTIAIGAALVDRVQSATKNLAAVAEESVNLR